MNRERRRRLIGILLCVLVIGLYLSAPARAIYNWPHEIRVIEDDDTPVRFNLPFVADFSGSTAGLSVNGQAVTAEGMAVNLHDPVRLRAEEPGVQRLELKLFGFLPLPGLLVDVVPRVAVVPGGESVGVTLVNKGSIVVGLADEEETGGSLQPAREAGIRVGDIILAVDGLGDPTEEDVARIVNSAGHKGDLVRFTVQRGSTTLDFEVSPAYVPMLDRYRVGLYVRDRASGVGTLTFVDRITGRFGALGHLVTDNDTGQALTVKSGQIVAATVASVEASQKGAPGSKRSVVVAHERVLGAIEKNTQFGIFGDWSGDMPQDAEMSIALHRQVYPGHAQMLTVIKGEKVEAFDIEIERVNEQNLPAQKGLVIKVTDERLLREVGGIVQGMSGSPIVQDGRLVGAVTHVFVNDPTRGYGILAEWMVQESGLLERRQQTAPTFFYRQFGRGI